MRQFARIELGGRHGAGRDTILQFRRLLERHGLTGAIFQAVGEHLAAHGLVMRQGTLVDATLITRRVRRRTGSGRAIPRRARRRKEISGTSA
jgi:hypothetical protein